MRTKLLDLMKTLKLTGMSQVLERELALAEKEGLATAQVIERLLLEEFHYRQERSLLYRVSKAECPGPGPSSLSPLISNPQ